MDGAVIVSIDETGFNSDISKNMTW
jgi:hypothetical protein